MPQIKGRLAPAHGLLQALDIGVHVLVQQLQKQPEILGVALVRRGGHQQEMVGHLGQVLPELIGQRLLVRTIGAHLVGLIDDDDGLARAGVVRQQKSNARKAQEIVVDGLKLMRQRVYAGNGQAEVGVVLVGEAKAQLGLSVAISIKDGGRENCDHLIDGQVRSVPRGIAGYRPGRP